MHHAIFFFFLIVGIIRVSYGAVNAIGSHNDGKSIVNRIGSSWSVHWQGKPCGSLAATTQTFNLNVGKLDWVLENTSFCAISLSILFLQMQT